MLSILPIFVLLNAFGLPFALSQLEAGRKSEQGVRDFGTLKDFSPDTFFLVERSIPSVRKFTRSICQYAVSQGKHEAYNVDVVLDPSWKEYCLEGNFPNMLWAGCPEFTKDINRAYWGLSRKKDLCRVRFRMTRKANTELSFPEEGPLGCMKNHFMCLAEAWDDVDKDLLPEQCEEVPLGGNYWSVNNFNFNR